MTSMEETAQDSMFQYDDALQPGVVQRIHSVVCLYKIYYTQVVYVQSAGLRPIVVCRDAVEMKMSFIF